MKGDFTRNTFKSAKHYNRVLMQQGRVQVDADWNEAVDILAHWDRTTRRDVIGPCGGPQGQAGFLIKVVNDELQIGKGRYYVDGLLVENEDPVVITEQPDLPVKALDDVLFPAGRALSPGMYLAYLDVWERHITALEDPAIREVALGGPDTTTRTKAVWQVRLLQVPSDLEEEATCDSDLPLWLEVTAPSSGRLTAQAEPGGKETEPCEVPAQAGYRGLENQLYRVEVHRVLSDKKITLKWSRENGSVVFGWADQDNLNPNKLTLSSPGRDEVLGLATDDWVELIDDKHELRGEPGLLVKVVAMEGMVLTIDPGSETVKRSEFPTNPKVRRWDMPRDVGEIFVDLTKDEWIPLENGVEVKLELGTYRTGDYWLIPARTASRNIEWPRDEDKKPRPQPPHGIQHHYCRLALLNFKGDESEAPWERLSDCRRLFPPLTEMVRFFQVAGDGQKALPGKPLPRPLQVGVVNGQRPVAEARVQFQVVGGNGRLRTGKKMCLSFATGGAQKIVVETGPDGVAGCCWRLDKGTPSQQVEATLLEIDGKPLVDGDGKPLLTPIRFNANPSEAERVAYDPQKCPDLKTAQTVQQAIDLLCQRPQGGGACCVTVGRDGEYQSLEQALRTLLEKKRRDICLCLLPGDHPFPGLELDFPVEESEFHLKIVGCGRGSRVFMDRPLRFRGLKAFTLHEVALEPQFLAKGDMGAVALDRCDEVRLTGCHLSGFTDGDEKNAKGVLLSITNADRIHLRDNVIEAAVINSLKQISQNFKEAKVDFLEKLFGLPEKGIFNFEQFRLDALASARQLAKLNADQRQQIFEKLKVPSGDEKISAGEKFAFGKFRAALKAKEPQAGVFYDSLLDIRRAAIKTRPGVALMLSTALWEETSPDVEIVGRDDDDFATLESNDLLGILSLYGMPAPADFIPEVFREEFLKVLKVRVQEQQISLVGRLGTLQMRGNQLVQITVARDTIEKLQESVSTSPGPSLHLFGRCLMSDNIIEGAISPLLTEHLAMTGNAFTTMALPVFSVETSGVLPPVAIVVAGSSIYLGNHCRGEDGILRDISRAHSEAANLQINFT